VDRNLSSGPQARAHAWAESQSHVFSTMYESGVSSDGKKSFYEFASYKDSNEF
ncbi:hypothetical protein BGX27_004174, partial [Mortierella sp. AM989]